MARSIETCQVIKRAVNEMIGYPELDNGKCMGYSTENDDEPIEKCKKCKFCTVPYEEGGK